MEDRVLEIVELQGEGALQDRPGHGRELEESEQRLDLGPCSGLTDWAGCRIDSSTPR